MKIAVSGKGGVGKTTVSAALVNYFSRRGEGVYAVDADPDASLGITLGIDPNLIAEQVPLIEMKEVIENKNAGGGALVDLNPDIEDVLDEYSLTMDKVSFLRMGGVKQGGSACYCKENSFLQSLLNSLLIDKEEVVVLDMSAGIEHLTRGTSRGVDLMLVVTEPSLTSVRTSLLVDKLATELSVKNIYFVGNKIRGAEEVTFLKDALPPNKLLGILPFDEKVMCLARGRGDDEEMLENELFEEMNQIMEKLIGGEGKTVKPTNE